MVTTLEFLPLITDASHHQLGGSSYLSFRTHHGLQHFPATRHTRKPSPSASPLFTFNTGPKAFTLTHYISRLNRYALYEVNPQYVSSRTVGEGEREREAFYRLNPIRSSVLSSFLDPSHASSPPFCQLLQAAAIYSVPIPDSTSFHQVHHVPSEVPSSPLNDSMTDWLTHFPSDLLDLKRSNLANLLWFALSSNTPSLMLLPN